MPRCRLEFHQISRHVSSPCLPEPPLLALRHTSVQWRSSQQSPFPKRGMAFTTNKSASTATRVAACFCSVSPLADVVFTNPKSSGSQGAVLPSRASHYGDVGHLFPRPMTHCLHHGTANSFLLVSRYSSSSFFLASICSKPSKEHVLRPVNRGSQFAQPGM